MPKPHHILAVDIGGTNSRFALRRADAVLGPVVWNHRESTAQAASIHDLLDRALADLPVAREAIDILVLGVPAAIHGLRCSPPNIAWDIDLTGGVRGFSRVELVNDFVCQGWALCSDAVDGAEVLQAGQCLPGGVRSVIGAGTGLGHCTLVPSGNGRFVAVPSESGHGPFGFYGEWETEFEAWIRAKLGYDQPEVEYVVRGRGLSLIHEYRTGRELGPGEVVADGEEGRRTVARFARFYGRAARQYALAVLPMGGLYLSGGVAAKSPEVVRAPEFLEEFTRSPEYAPLLRSLPVLRFSGRDVGLAGAARLGLQRLHEASDAC